MDVLNSLFTKASELELLTPLATHNPPQRISLYADDVALFIRPIAQEMNLTMDILATFGVASGLQTNLQKSCVIPIRCEEEELEIVSTTLPCPTSSFPCTYLGLPISNSKLKKADLMLWIEKVENKLLGWKTSLMNMAGRVTWVRFVLTAVPIYVLIAIKVPKWFIRAINKLRRAFTWKGRKQVNGGSCLVAWDKVQRPLELGGLGILNLEIMSWALQIRWLWFEKTDSHRAWRGLEVHVHPNARALFAIALESHVGDGQNTLFWTDKWIMGCSVSDLAPLVFEVVPLAIRKERTVAQGMQGLSWLADISGGLNLIGLYEYFQLWDVIAETHLSQEEDSHFWRFDSSGQFSSKSAYQAFFNGAIPFEHWKRLWKSWAPQKCKVFLWLAMRERCWTADRLAKRGLPHPAKCVLCDQEDEDIQHLLTTCVVSQDFWFQVLVPLGFGTKAPGQHETSFVEWWKRAAKQTPKEKKKGLNSIIILGAWTIWKHRNACVFECEQPSISGLLREFKEGYHLWCLAGARDLRELGNGLGSEHGLF